MGVGPFTYTWTPNVSATDAVTGLCAGTYEVEIVENNDCVQTTTIVIGSSTEVTAQLHGDVTTICIGQTANLEADLSGRTPPYSNFAWDAVPVDPGSESNSSGSSGLAIDHNHIQLCGN